MKTFYALLLLMICLTNLSNAQDTFNKTLPGISVDGQMIAAKNGLLACVTDHYFILTDLYFHIIIKKQLTFSEDHFSQRIIQLNDGSFLLLLSEPIDFQPTLLVKLSSTGQLIWSKRTGTCQQILDIAPSKDGGFVATGSGNQVIKFDADGSIIWQHRFKPNDYPEGCGIGGGHGIRIIATEKGYAIAGTWSFAQTYNSFPTLFCINESGELEWFKAYNMYKFYFNNSLLQLPDGSFTILGTQRDTTDDLSTQAVNLIHTDSNGNIIWNKDYLFNVQLGSASDFIHSSKNEYIITGFVNYHNDTDNQVLCFKTDTNGNALWAKETGGISQQGIGSDYGQDIIGFDDGQFMLRTSTSDGMTFIRATSTGEGICGSKDLTIYKSPLFPSTDNLNCTSLPTGWSLTDIPVTINSNSHTVVNICPDNYSAIEPEETLKKTEVYPNPNQGSFNINPGLSVPGTITIELMDMWGKILFYKKYDFNPNEDITMNNTGLNAGIYMLRIIGENKYKTKKVIITDL